MRNLLVITFFVAVKAGLCQDIAINKTGASPHSSAVLDISGGDGGLLIPRMTSAQRAAISSPAAGLMVFDTDLNKTYLYNGSGWDWIEGSDSAFTVVSNNSYMLQNGNVGVGVNSPTAKLDVNGSFQLARSSGQVEMNLGNGNATPKWQISTENAGLYNYQGNLIFKSKEGNLWNDPLVEQLRITYDGKVGIGGSPNYLLDVYGRGNMTSLRIKDASNGGQMLLESKGSQEAYFYIGNENSSLQRASNHLSLFGNNVPVRISANNGSSDALYISTSNFVGIGTSTTSSGKLNVERNGAGEQNVLAIGNTNGGVNSEANIVFYQNQSSQGLGKIGAYVTANSPYDSDLRFSTVDNGNWNDDVMVITAEGQLSVGTTDPDDSAILELSSTSQGFAPPAMTTIQRNAISNPAVALTIFNTTLNCIQYYTGVDWYSFGCQ